MFKAKKARLDVENNFYLNKRMRFRQNIPLLIMFIPILVYYIVFRYLPIGGLIIAFKDYNLFDGVMGSPWVGFKNFQDLFSYPNTLRIIRNTFVLSVTSLLVGFPAPITLAILLNEVRKLWYKKIVQTIVYLPHFFSWVIVGGIVITIFSMESGIINNIVENISGEPYPFLYKPVSWIGIFIASGIWKEMGFSTIIYLAALTSIDPNLYEAARIDGANKFREIWHITLPSIRSTIVILFILRTGSILKVGFNQVYNLSNGVVSNVADVISTYSYRVGIQGAQYSITTALGFFEAIVGLILILGTNWLAKKYDQGLW